MRPLLLAFLVLISLPLRAADDPAWTTPIAPFRIADNLFYVGTRDLASYLVITPVGNILINANLESSPPLIRHSVEQLGFRWSDTKILLNAQAHFDHVAGAAQVLRETHAQNMVMQGDVKVVETGGRADFLYPQSVTFFPPAHVDRILHDGDTVTLGGVTLTAHLTPGHTRGCTTWTFRVHMPGDPPTLLRNVVIVGGTTFWPAFHFVGLHPSYPGIAQDFEHTFATLHALPCDLFLGAHGQYFDMLAKLKRYADKGPRVFIDPVGYVRFVNSSRKTFEAELAHQQAAQR
jgi:metallo-beta-lactamase class B